MNELVHEAIAGDERAIVYLDMAAKQRAVGDDDVVADVAVVRDVGVGHEEIVVPNYCIFFVFVGAMNGHAFAKGVVVSNAQARRSVFVFQVLRSFADNCACKNFVVRANGAVAGDVSVRADNAARPEDNVFINDRERAHRDVGVELGFGMDNSRRMNHVRHTNSPIPAEKHNLFRWARFCGQG